MIWKARGKRFYKGEILWVWRKAKSFKTETRPSLVAATAKVVFIELRPRPIGLVCLGYTQFPNCIIGCS